MRYDLLEKQAKDSGNTHDAVCKTQHSNVMAEHKTDNLVVAEDAAVGAPVVC